MKSRPVFQAELIVSIVIAAVGLLKNDFLVITYALCSALFSVVLIRVSKEGEVDTKISLISMSTLIIGTILFIYVLNYSTEPFVDKRTYAHIEGLVAWVIAYPLAYLATECIVLLFNASLNKYLVAGFMVFNSEALTSLMLIAISIFETEELDITFMFVDELAYLFMGLVMSLIAAFITCIALRGKKYRMCRETLVVSE